MLHIDRDKDLAILKVKEAEDVAFHFYEFGDSKSLRMGGNVFAHTS